MPLQASGPALNPHAFARRNFVLTRGAEGVSSGLCLGGRLYPPETKSEIGSRFMSIIPTNLVWGTIIGYGSGGIAGQPANRRERTALRLDGGGVVGAWRSGEGDGWFAECNSAIQQSATLRYETGSERADRQERTALRLDGGGVVGAWRSGEGDGGLAECHSAIRQIKNLRYGIRPLMAADACARFFTPEGRTMNVGARD